MNFSYSIPVPFGSAFPFVSRILIVVRIRVLEDKLCIFEERMREAVDFFFLHAII